MGTIEQSLENTWNLAFLRTVYAFLPFFVRNNLKKIFRGMVWILNKSLYVRKGRNISWGRGFRVSVVRPFGVDIKDGTNIDACNIWNAKNGVIEIGSNCWIGYNNIIMGPVHIGDHVSTGPRVTILGPRHATMDYRLLEEKEETVIGKNVWISTGAVILFGVKIGDNAIIGPGTIVAKDVNANAYVAGNPARDLSRINTLDLERRIYENADS